MQRPQNDWLRAGQAISIGRAIITIVALGLIYSLASAAWRPFKAEADAQVTNSTAQEGLRLTGLMFDNFLLFALFVIAAGAIALAVFQRQGP